MESQEIPRKLWEHPDPASTEMYRFMGQVNRKRGLQLKTFNELYDYSISNRSQFWDHCFQFVNIIYSGAYAEVVKENARIDSLPLWFEGVHINFAENLLYTRDLDGLTTKRGTKGKEDDKIALTEVREGVTEIRHISWGQLRSEVAELASAMRCSGFGKGDRCAIVASNSIDTLKVFLATTALGGLFSSSSTDMGTKGILDRLLQIEPKLVFMDDWAVYNGKTLDLRPKMRDIILGVKGVKEFTTLVSMPRFRDQELTDISSIPKTQLLKNFLSEATSKTLEFEKMAFRDPFMIAYSSGTTGMPKCIVHSIGGALLSSAKEVILHRNIKSDAVTLQFTTTGWIMYFSQVVNLFVGAHVVLYDGSPFLPNLTTFIKLVGLQKVTQLGISPRWMMEMRKNNVVPKDIADFSHLKSVISTGMVLSDQLFEWFYDVGFPKHVQLANISGGTDIAACFGLENPLTPVYVGGTQGRALGIPVSVFDSTIEGGNSVKGVPVDHGIPGELVAHQAFPNMPVYFYNDPDGSRYFSAYFEKYDNVWTHGDFVVIHPITEQLIFLGRADGVLNPSGVRFGSTEIYSVLENRFPQLADSICVGQRRPQDTDESVMLFLLMQRGEKFTPQLVHEVKAAIREDLSPRHVPKYVFETPEIPTTINLKKVELPVKQIVSGRIIKPSGTLLNPNSLKYYYQFAKVENLAAPKSRL